MSVAIEIGDGIIAVDSPYNRDFIDRAKMTGGKWSGGVWEFPVENEAEVRNLCMDIYGSDGERDETCTVLVEFSRDCPASFYTTGSRQPLTVSGVHMASAFGRDSGARLADGVILVGGAVDSGGSVKNYHVWVEPGSVFKVRNFPRGRLHAAENEWGAGRVTKTEVDDETDEEAFARKRATHISSIRRIMRDYRITAADLEEASADVQ